MSQYTVSDVRQLHPGAWAAATETMKGKGLFYPKEGNALYVTVRGGSTYRWSPPPVALWILVSKAMPETSTVYVEVERKDDGGPNKPTAFRILVKGEFDGEGRRNVILGAWRTTEEEVQDDLEALKRRHPDWEVRIGDGPTRLAPEAVRKLQTSSTYGKVATVKNLLTIWDVLKGGERQLVHACEEEGTLITYEPLAGRLEIWTLTYNAAQGAGWWKRTEREVALALPHERARQLAEVWQTEWEAQTK